MKLCFIGIHKYGKFEAYKEEPFKRVWANGVVGKMVKITQKRTCTQCGITEFNSQEIPTGFGKR